MKRTLSVFLSVLSVAVLSGCKTCCKSSCSPSPFAQYDNITTVQKLELKRTSESWDGSALPDLPQGEA